MSFKQIIIKFWELIVFAIEHLYWILCHQNRSKETRYSRKDTLQIFLLKHNDTKKQK